MDPHELDSLLSMMALDDLSEALDVIQEWLADGRLSEESAATWRERIAGWEEHRRRSR